MSFIGNLVRKINLLDSRLEQLVGVTTPNKNKILLDVIIKLYDDEVSRYRWLEEKAVKLLNVILFLATSITTVLSWLFINHSYIFNIITWGSIIISYYFIIISIVLIIRLLRITNKSALSISNKNISAANNDKELYNDFYSGLLKRYNRDVIKYRGINIKKAREVNKAYMQLQWLLLSICFLIVIISLTIFLPWFLSHIPWFSSSLWFSLWFSFINLF